MYTPKLAIEDHSSKPHEIAFFEKIGSAVGVGGGLYLGLQVARVLNKLILGKGKKSESEYFNITLVEDIRADQEELWRVVHRIYSENIAGFDNVTQHLR